MVAHIPSVLIEEVIPYNDHARELAPTSVREPNVLFLTHTGRIGGAEVCLLNIVQAFDGDVLLFEDGALRLRLLAQGSRVTVPKLKLDLRAIRRDRGMLKVLPVLIGVVRLVRHLALAGATRDLVYCNSQKSFVLGALASCLNRTPLLWHLHDILDTAHFGRSQIRLVIILANKLATRVVAPSQAVADAFIVAGGRRALVAVVPNGVSVPPAAPGPDERAALRQRLDLPMGFLFGVFSRLAPWKGQNIAIEALAQLPDASCIIAGDALFGEEKYSRSLRTQAERLGVASRVRFLGHRDDVAALMQAVDVVVHPSIDPEPFGLTLVEAMLAETPVVASSTGAAGEILDGGRVGTLVTPGDVVALAAAVERCRGRPEIIERQVVAGRRYAELHFSVERLRRDIRSAVIAVAHVRDQTRQNRGMRAR